MKIGREPWCEQTTSAFGFFFFWRLKCLSFAVGKEVFFSGNMWCCFLLGPRHLVEPLELICSWWNGSTLGRTSSALKFFFFVFRTQMFIHCRVASQVIHHIWVDSAASPPGGTCQCDAANKFDSQLVHSTSVHRSVVAPCSLAEILHKSKSYKSIECRSPGAALARAHLEFEWHVIVTFPPFLSVK